MKKTLAAQGLGITNFIMSILSLTIICVTLYLIKHFFDANFPESLESASGLCSISSFLNCDSATFSPAAHLWGMPTGVFGLVFGLMIFIGVFSSSEKLEQQNKFLSLINAIGCLGFLIYSLVVLKTLCPFCTVYYLLSFAVLYIFHTQSNLKYRLDIKHGSWQLLILLTIGGIFSYNYHNSKKQQDLISEKIIKEFLSLAEVGNPSVESSFFIQNVAAPKVTISIFSDFQCPFCKKLAEQMQELSRRFKNDLKINYYFFPLDAKCNPEVKNTIHDLACEAAKVASCDASKFLSIHDEIFADQENMTDKSLDQLRKKYSLDNCPSLEQFNALILDFANVAKSYNVKSTPTFILNGRKIEGLVPTNHLSALIDYLVKHN